ncbi:RpnC/YadD family protein, partial [Dethiosulfovibrio salsuginis]
DDSRLQMPRNLVAALIRMENSRSHQDLRLVIRELIDWLQLPEHTKIRRSFTVFLRGVLLPKRIPDKDFSTYEDLLEVDTMLAEKVRDWTRAWEKEGLRKGIHRGRREGLERGLQRGIKQGKQEGREKGLIQTAIRMLEKDMELAVIVDITGLPLEKIKDISENREKYAAELES